MSEILLVRSLRENLSVKVYEDAEALGAAAAIHAAQSLEALAAQDQEGVTGPFWANQLSQDLGLF